MALIQADKANQPIACSCAMSYIQMILVYFYSVQEIKYLCRARIEFIFEKQSHTRFLLKSLIRNVWQNEVHGIRNKPNAGLQLFVKTFFGHIVCCSVLLTEKFFEVQYLTKCYGQTFWQN